MKISFSINRLIAIAVSVILLVASTTAQSDLHVFGVGGKPILCVPTTELDPLLLQYADSGVDNRPGSGRVPGFAFWFSPESIRAFSPRYVVVMALDGHPYANALLGTVGFLGEDDRKRLGPSMRARAVEDQWYGQGQCSNRAIAPLVGIGFFKIQCEAIADYAAVWNRAPSPSMTMPVPDEFVVATCRYAEVNRGPYAGQIFKNCTRVINTGELLVEYRIQEENMNLIPDLDLTVRHRIAQWKENCRDVR